MTKWIGAAMLALTLTFGGSAAIHSAAAATSDVAARQAAEKTDISARRRIRHPARYAYRAYAPPQYYDRPDYYRPYPYVLPLPFFLGFGFGPLW
jgi:hypothetical protein